MLILILRYLYEVHLYPKNGNFQITMLLLIELDELIEEKYSVVKYNCYTIERYRKKK